MPLQDAAAAARSVRLGGGGRLFRRAVLRRAAACHPPPTPHPRRRGGRAAPLAAAGGGRGCHARALLRGPAALGQGSFLPHRASPLPRHRARRGAGARRPPRAPPAAAQRRERAAARAPPPGRHRRRRRRRHRRAGCEFECAAGHRFLAPPGTATAPPPRNAIAALLRESTSRRGRAADHRRLPPDRPAAANLRAHASSVGAARAVPEVSFAPPDVLLATTGDDADLAEGRRLVAGVGLRRGGVGGAAARPRLPAAACVYCGSGGRGAFTAATRPSPPRAEGGVGRGG